MTYIDRVKAPLLISRARAIRACRRARRSRSTTRSRSAASTSQLIIFADEGHGACKRGNLVLQVGHVIRFFEENLKGAK